MAPRGWIRTSNPPVNRLPGVRDPIDHKLITARHIVFARPSDAHSRRGQRYTLPPPPKMPRERRACRDCSRVMLEARAAGASRIWSYTDVGRNHAGTILACIIFSLLLTHPNTSDSRAYCAQDPTNMSLQAFNRTNMWIDMTTSQARSLNSRPFSFNAPGGAWRRS